MEHDADDRHAGITRQAAAYRDAVMRHIDPGHPCAIAGFPDHDNSGDAAIYLGEIALFDEIGAKIAYVCSRRTHDNDIEAHYPEGPIFLHGGGNLGDLHPDNKLRLAVLRKYRNRRLVQLPQSIHFEHEENVEKMVRAIGEHGNVHLMLRDLPSYEFARERFDCSAELVPDAAYFLQRLTAPGHPRHDVLSIQRMDVESVSGSFTAQLSALGPIRDWQGPNAPWAQTWIRARRRLRRHFTAHERKVVENVAYRETAYRAHAQQRLNLALGLLGRARVIVADRLHAHILSSLLRKPHVVLDNSYRKIGNYMDAWGNDGLALAATNPEELASAVSRHLEGEAVPVIDGEAWSRLG